MSYRVLRFDMRRSLRDCGLPRNEGSPAKALTALSDSLTVGLSRCYGQVPMFAVAADICPELSCSHVWNAC